MKSAKDILESLLDDDDELFKQYDVKGAICSYIKEHFTIENSKQWEDQLKVIERPGKKPLVDLHNQGPWDIITAYTSTPFENDLFDWGVFAVHLRVTGDKIKNLKGMPTLIRSLHIEDCPNFQSLDGLEKSSMNGLHIDSCPKLKDTKLLDKIRANQVESISLHNCPKLTDVVVPIGCTESTPRIINCPNVKTLKLNNKLINWGCTMFEDNNRRPLKLQKFIINNKILNFDHHFFEQCPDLKEVCVNKAFKEVAWLFDDYCKYKNIKISYFS